MIEVHQIFSEHLQAEREVYVYLPPSYEHTEATYPVLYMQDGQNVFAEAGESPVRWDMDLSARELIDEGLIEELIIVGIANSPWRDDEYTPFFDEEEGSGGSADQYLHFLVDEVKGFVDATYRVRPFREDTGIGGSSLGGLLALYAAMSYPQFFGKIAAISPSIAWGERLILDMARDWDVDPDEFMVWLDMGLYELDEDEEEDVDLHPVVEADILCGILQDHGFRMGENLRYFTDHWGFHHETSWANRVGQVLTFLYGI